MTANEHEVDYFVPFDPTVSLEVSGEPIVLINKQWEKRIPTFDLFHYHPVDSTRNFVWNFVTTKNHLVCLFCEALKYRRSLPEIIDLQIDFKKQHPVPPEILSLQDELIFTKKSRDYLNQWNLRKKEVILYWSQGLDAWGNAPVTIKPAK
jgi:hypothetical protein